MVVPEFAFSVKLRRARHEALTRRDVGDHPGEQVLDELKRANRPAELQSFLRVFERTLVGAHLAAGRLPSDEIPRHAQYPRGVAERFARLKVVLLRDANIL